MLVNMLNPPWQCFVKVRGAQLLAALKSSRSNPANRAGRDGGKYICSSLCDLLVGRVLHWLYFKLAERTELLRIQAKELSYKRKQMLCFSFCCVLKLRS